jgi:hypothetical protein
MGTYRFIGLFAYVTAAALTLNPAVTPLPARRPVV